jgi:TRAP-type C4-dicarboxylate transport system substrate-binding protein
MEQAQLPMIGAHVVPLPVEQAGRAYDERRVDGFIVVPTAAVYYRFGVKARYFTDLRSMFLPGCLVVSRRAIDGLDGKEQQALRSAAERLGARFAALGREQDEEVLTRVLPEQGLREVPMSPAFRREYTEAARAACAWLGPRLVPLTLVSHVMNILRKLRGERASSAAR